MFDDFVVVDTVFRSEDVDVCFPNACKFYFDFSKNIGRMVYVFFYDD